MSLRFWVALIIHLFYNLLRYVVFLSFPYEWIALSFLTNVTFSILTFRPTKSHGFAESLAVLTQISRSHGNIQYPHSKLRSSIIFFFSTR